MRRALPRNETGSALALVPAVVLVVLLLSSLALDSALVYLGQRRLEHAADAAANDAAAAALDRTPFEAGTALDPDLAITIDPAKASILVSKYVAQAGRDGLEVTSVVTRVELDPEGHQARLVVEVEGSMRVVFGDALPGGADRRAIRARSVVDLSEAT
jgi:hypothetical protein